MGKKNRIACHLIGCPLDEDEEATLIDAFPEGRTLLEADTVNRDLLTRLIARLRDLDPDADTILACGIRSHVSCLYVY